MFGLQATAVALRARGGDPVDLRARLALAQAALRLTPPDGTAGDAAAAFLETVDRSPEAAGRELQGFVLHWLDGIGPHEAETVLAQAGPETLFAWQDRADLR